MMETRETSPAESGQGVIGPLTRRTIFVVVLACVGALLLVRVGWGQSREAWGRMDRGNLAKSVYLMAWLDAEEHEHVLPVLDWRAGRLFYSVRDAHPAYAIDNKLTGPLEVSQAPLLVGDVDGYKAYTLKPIADPADYVYLGYALSSEAELLAFIEAFHKQSANGQPFDTDVPASAGHGSFSGDVFVRLRTDLAQSFQDKGLSADEAARRVSSIPVLIEKPKPGPHPGGWVVYLDRHTEYLPYPGPFPMTESVIAALKNLEEHLGK